MRPKLTGSTQFSHKKIKIKGIVDQNFLTIKEKSKERLQKESSLQKHATAAVTKPGPESRLSLNRKKSLPHISNSSNEDRETA